MRKYEVAKTLKLTKARVPRTCDVCGERIEKGVQYLRESLGSLAKPPGLHLESYCITCGNAKTHLT